MSKPVRVGLIGCGSMGMGLGQAMARDAASVLSAVVDVDAEAAAQAAQKFRATAFDTPSDLIGSGSVDAVVIATPPSNHEALTAEAVSAGLHVFCEKPLALSTAACERMIDGARRAGVVLMVGHVLRYFAMPSHVLEKVRSGEAGQPRALHMTRSGHGWRPDAGWRTQRSLCGGLLAEVNIHEIDFMRCLLGEVESVYAIGGNHRNPHLDFEDTIQLVLRFRGGGAGTLFTSLASEFNQYKMTLLCSGGTFQSVNFWEQVVFKAAGGAESVFEAKDFRGQPPFVRELTEFVASIREGAPVTIPGEEGLAALRIIEAAETALRTGQVVALS